MRKDDDAYRSAVDRRIRLARIKVLLADSDARTASLVRRVMYNFGFRLMDVARDGEQALTMLAVEHYDLFITEYSLKYIDGPELIRRIRQWSVDDAIARDMPIIMLTARAEVPDVELSRDSGVNEFVRKPFTAQTLSSRIIKVIDNPRIFVNSDEYAGPCRRRRGPLPPSGIERRTPPPKVKTSRVGTTMPLPANGEASRATAELSRANTDIRERLGGDVSAADIITELVIEEAQKTLQHAEGEFIDWARDDIGKLEEAFQELLGKPDDPTAHYLLLSAAYAIKSQAGIFGYDLGSDVAGMLVEYLNIHKEMDTKSLVVVRKHIDTINVIFTKQIKDAERKIAVDFVESLQSLIDKLG